MKTKLRRSAVTLLCCWGVVSWMMGPVIAQGTRIRLDPETLALTPGDVETVEIWVEDVARLAGAEVHLAFDSTLLAVVDADPETEGVQVAHGDFLSPDFVAQNVVTQTTAGSSTSTIDYAIVCMPLDKAVSGSGVLARITFRALAEGEAQVRISGALLSDTESQPIAAEADSSTAVIIRSGPSLGVWGLIVLVAVAVAAGIVVVVWRTVKNR